MDFRQAVRPWRRQPAFAACVIGVLALAVGANTAMYTLVQTIVLRPLPLREPDRLLTFSIVRPGTDRQPLSLPDLADFAQSNRTLEGIASLFGWSANLTGSGDAERLTAMRVSANYFDLTGARVQLGRAIQPDDEQRAVALLSHGMWQRRFGGARRCGRHVNRSQRRDLHGCRRPAAGLRVAGPRRRARRALFAGGRCAAQQPRAGIPARDRAVEAWHHATRRRPTISPRSGDGCVTSTRTRTAPTPAIRVARLHDEISGRSAPMLWMLLGAVVVVLLVACANLANLFLVRGTARQRELAVRTALGASRSRIVGHVLGEAAVLGVLGGAAGLLVARMLVAALLAIGPADLPRVAEIGIGGRPPAFTLLAALGTSAPHRPRAGGASLAGRSSRRAPGRRTRVEPRRPSCAHRPGVRGSRALDGIADDGRAPGAQLPAGAGRRSRLPSGAGPHRPAVAATRAVQRAGRDRELLQPGAAPPRVDRRGPRRGGRQRRAR